MKTYGLDGQVTREWIKIEVIVKATEEKYSTVLRN